MWGRCPHRRRVTERDRQAVAEPKNRRYELPAAPLRGDRERQDTMPFSDNVKTLIRNAWDDGYPCLVATLGPQGPNITPKGSMIVFDDMHLAWWERSKRAVLENLGHDKRVCVMYANFKAQRDGILESGFLRFFGSVELHESGPTREAIFAKLLPREQTHAGAEAGIGALVRIEKAIDIRGKPIA